jgi:hypothetical protein
MPIDSIYAGPAAVKCQGCAEQGGGGLGVGLVWQLQQLTPLPAAQPQAAAAAAAAAARPTGQRRCHRPGSSSDVVGGGRLCLDVLASRSVLVVGWPSPCPGAAQAPLTKHVD